MRLRNSIRNLDANDPAEIEKVEAMMKQVESLYYDWYSLAEFDYVGGEVSGITTSISRPVLSLEATASSERIPQVDEDFGRITHFFPNEKYEPSYR